MQLSYIGKSQNTNWRPEVRIDEVGCLLLQQLDGVAGAICRTPIAYDCWKHLLRQQEIAIILAIQLHPSPRVDKYQFSHRRINKICNLRHNLPFLDFVQLRCDKTGLSKRNDSNFVRSHIFRACIGLYVLRPTL